MISAADYNHGLTEWIASIGIMASWPGCQKVFLEKLSADSPSVVALPILSCMAVGGTDSDAVPVAAVWSMLRYAAELFDALQDGDDLPKSVNNSSSAIEFANGLIFSAFNAIATIHEQNIARQLTSMFSDLAFQASQGQQLSQQCRRNNGATLETYWQSIILKSGSIFRAGLEGGAIVGQTNTDFFTALSNFGNELGVIRQVIDDCRDVFDDPDTNKIEITLPLLLLAEKLSEPIPLLVKHFKSKEPLSKALKSNGVPEMLTSVLLEWHRRALENLMVLGQTEETRALESILQDFVTKPWLNFSNE